MKFLHLSDLHIGKAVNGFTMLAEQRHVFRQVVGYVRSERPAAVVIAGDVYDRAVPGTEAVRVFDDFLTDLCREGVAVLLISGNHDSPERLGYASRLLKDKRLFLCGAFEGSPRKVVLDDEYGDVNFWLLPFIKPSSARSLFGGQGGGNEGSREEGHGGEGRVCEGQGSGEEQDGGEGQVGGEGGRGEGHGGEEREGDVQEGDARKADAREIESYGDALAAALEAADIDYSARNVLVSHQFFTKVGVTPIRSESELDPVGGLDAIDAGLVYSFDYVALGHLHGAQRVGAEHVRYAGSPLKYSFSEIRHAKSTLLVELKRKGDLSVRALPLAPLHDMREIKGDLRALASDEVSSLADKEDYLRVILTDEEEIVDPMGKIRSVYPNVMALGFENSRTRAEMALAGLDSGPGADYCAGFGSGVGSDHGAGNAAPQRLSPYDLFCEFFLDVSGSAMSEEQSRIVRTLLESEEPAL